MKKKQKGPKVHINKKSKGKSMVGKLSKLADQDRFGRQWKV